jgi:3-dehydroquinate dehydratase-2
VRIDVLNGVNLDVLGKRDPTLYGGLSLGDLETRIYGWAGELGMNVRCRQTNHEGEYVEWCHAITEGSDGAILNPGAWTHYAWAIRDALDFVGVPLVEVHLSKVEEREEWRRPSVLEGVVAHRITGKGPDGYREALEYFASR